MTKVYVFHGTGSMFCNAVFTSLQNAEGWIAGHTLTGLLTVYYLDDPGYEREKREGVLPSYVAGAEAIQRYVSGKDHYHFFYGVGEDHPGFTDASIRWAREHGA